jgi:hypothetical protein
LPVLRNDVLVKVPQIIVSMTTVVYFVMFKAWDPTQKINFQLFFLRIGNVGSQVQFPKSGNFLERDTGVVTFVTSRCSSFISSSVDTRGKKRNTVSENLEIAGKRMNSISRKFSLRISHNRCQMNYVAIYLEKVNKTR